MSDKLNHIVYFTGAEMKKIDNIVRQIRTIMETNSISQNFIVAAADGKCSRSTILNFLKGDGDCKMSTFLLILDIIGAELRIDTEMSKEAILSGDIAEYRTQAEQNREKILEFEKENELLQDRYNELIEKNTVLTQTVGKQQTQIEKYMERMEKAENALYEANSNIKRKDERIVELSQRLNIW